MPGRQGLGGCRVDAAKAVASGVAARTGRGRRACSQRGGTLPWATAVFFAFTRRSAALERWARGIAACMTDWGEEESEALLGKHSLGRTGVQVKRDKGFEPGVYCVYV